MHRKPLITFFAAKLTTFYRDEARHGKALEGLLNRYFKA